MPRLSLCLLLLSAGLVHGSIYNSLGKTPQMGWNTWNKFGCDISDELILETAKEIKKLGLQDLGYTYVNIDDCWQGTRDPKTRKISADSSRFPQGIKHIADELHGLGFKVGIYSSAGIFTCGRREGSLGYEKEDAESYAEWGIDYLKYDNCYNAGQSGSPYVTNARYEKMAKALNATGREIFYSLCNWGEDQVWMWGPTTANSWRMSGDIYDNFDTPDERCPCGYNETSCWLPGFHCSMMNILNKASPLGQKAGPGGWNDLDMLEVGNGGMTRTEYITHFSMWALVKSPLILGNDITAISQEDLDIISNKHIIAVNQDPQGSPARRVWRRGAQELWVGSLVNSSYVVALLNSGTESTTISAPFPDFLGSDASDTFAVYDLWANATSIGNVTNTLEAEVEGHGVRVFKFVNAVGEEEKSARVKRGRWERGRGVGNGDL
ncbi:glycoside hydrolase family 27 protein [Atractiella rhizophila]|nr:glycoside hydrolase family 27 protein [Atractiella rhizophila]KAH8916763.1 glycoside hydrolase family 27 protein [Atractiella rhizophila]